jgi:hypothetical protein
MSDKEKSIVINISGENAVVNINTGKYDFGCACLGELADTEQTSGEQEHLISARSSTGSPGRG